MRDISDILSEWPFDPADCVRKVTADDGREVILVRTPLGLEQYEMEGRPDGAEPHGRESILEHVEAQLIHHVDQFGSADGFEIERSTASELQQEGLLYYYRYLVCFQIGEYNVVVRDTYRNLKMFDFIHDFCKDEESVNTGEQYRPYVLRMNAAARSLLAVGMNQYGLARSIIREALKTITEMPTVPTGTFEYERNRSLAILRGMRKAIPETRPLSQEARLRQELEKAVADEQYERAAAIRDALKALAEQPREPSGTPGNTP